MTGPVYASELLELQPKARIEGDVFYKALEMHQGATIDGELRPLKTEDKPSLKLAASSAGASADRASSAQAVLTSQIQKI